MWLHSEVVTVNIWCSREPTKKVEPVSYREDSTLAVLEALDRQSSTSAERFAVNARTKCNESTLAYYQGFA